VQDEIDLAEERLALMREVRQRLELLRRAGVSYRLRGETPLSVVPTLHQPEAARSRMVRREMTLVVDEPERGVADSVFPVSEETAPAYVAPAYVAPAYVAPAYVAPASIQTEPVASSPIPAEPLPKPAPPVAVTKRKPVPVATGSLFGEPAFDLPVIDASERPGLLAAEASIVAGCTKCKPLAETRTQTVFGVGSPTARLMFIGEAPGADEDRTGIPFVGKAGQLLTEMITKGMGIRREDVYIANILKCRPPENRQPTNAESANCIGYLERQIAIIRPEFLCLLGRTAAQGILETTVSMSHLRGKWHRYRDIATLVTYHPSYLLRNPPSKKEAWEDLQMLMKAMGLAIPRRK
jgi:DNA polymerase